MDVRTVRRKRLEQLLELAQAYQGCSRKELARILGRDRTKLVPASGVPKLDMVIDLCRVLDWPVGDVAGFLWPGSALPRQAPDVIIDADVPAEEQEYETLQIASRDAQRRGAYSHAVDLAQQAAAIAETAEQRALACNREAVGWDGLGHYSSALEAEQRGLQETSISPELRRILESNLANAYYTLWSLTEAKSLSRDLIDWYAEEPPATYRDRCTQAFSYYVRGNTLRRLISSDVEQGRRHAEAAGSDLEISLDLYRNLARDFDESFAGIGNTCRGALIEVEVALGRCDAADGLQQLTEGLDGVVDPDQCPPGDWLESFGWWCIFGCNIALRHVTDERELQHHMAIFTNKADEIADRMNNWSLRERVFTMQYASHQRFLDWTGRMLSLTLDNDDVKALVGTMGRFPTFRETGWKLLQTARVVRDE